MRQQRLRTADVVDRLILECALGGVPREALVLLQHLQQRGRHLDGQVAGNLIGGLRHLALLEVLDGVVHLRHHVLRAQRGVGGLRVDDGRRDGLGPVYDALAFGRCGGCAGGGGGAGGGGRGDASRAAEVGLRLHGLGEGRGLLVERHGGRLVGGLWALGL